MTDNIQKNNNLQKKALNLLNSGINEYFKKDFVSAANFIEEANRIFININDPINAAVCNAELALVQYEISDLNLANSYLLLKKAAKMIEGITHPPEIKAKITHYYGKLNYYEKRFAEALILYTNTLKQTDESSLEHAKILDSLAIFFLRLNNHQLVLKNLDRSLNIKKKINNKAELVYTELLIGRYLLSIENYEEASIHLDTALSLNEEIGFGSLNARILDELAKIYIYTEDFSTAEKLCLKSIQQAKDTKNNIELAFSLSTYSYILAINKLNDKALENLEKASLIFSELNINKGQAFINQTLSVIEFNKGNSEKSIENLNKAIEIFNKQGLYKEISRSYFSLAGVYKQKQDIQSALTYTLEAMKIAKSNNYPVLASKIESLLSELVEQELSERTCLPEITEAAFSTNLSLYNNISLFGNIETCENNNDPLIALLKIGKAIYNEPNLDKFLKIVAKETQNAMNADRCSVFLYDKNTNELYSRIASGIDNKEIRFSVNLGLAGYVFITGEIIKLDDAYSDPLFNKEIDEKTGYKTSTVLCMPMRNSNQEIIGVFQVINKLNNKSFTDNDIEILMSISSSVGRSLENVTLLKKQLLMYEDQKKSFKSFINTLIISIDARDKITADHSTNVTAYTLLTADQLGLSEEEKEIFEYAAILHDIGKLGIKDEVLCKKGKLTDEEYKHVQGHAKITYEILSKMYFEEKLKNVPQIAAFHHEKFNGKGYYTGISGTDIPLGSRIIAIADVFDAITSQRHYRERMAFNQVLDILKNDADNHFDSKIIDKFFEINLAKIVKILTFKSENPLTISELSDFSKFNLNDFYLILNKDKPLLTADEKQIIDLFTRVYI
ncbi:MAG: HD domain-containing phosphohydrolase [bacterium]